MTSSQSLLRLMSIELWCHPSLWSFVIPFSSCSHRRRAGSFPSTRVFSSQFFTLGGQSIGPSASASVLPNKYSGLISFRIERFDLLLIQGSLKSLIKHYSSKASILQCSDFFMVHILHPYMTTGKITALTKWTFAGKKMSLIFNMFSRLVIAFLPRSKCLLISWLQSPSVVILEPKKIKSVTASIVSPSICHEEMEPDAMILVFWMLGFFFHLFILVGG